MNIYSNIEIRTSLQIKFPNVRIVYYCILHIDTSTKLYYTTKINIQLYKNNINKAK